MQFNDTIKKRNKIFTKILRLRNIFHNMKYFTMKYIPYFSHTLIFSVTQIPQIK